MRRGTLTPGMILVVIGNQFLPTLITVCILLKDTLSISCTSTYSDLMTGVLAWCMWRKSDTANSPIILDCNPSTYMVLPAGLSQYLKQIELKKNSPMLLCLSSKIYQICPIFLLSSVTIFYRILSLFFCMIYIFPTSGRSVPIPRVSPFSRLSLGFVTK